VIEVTSQSTREGDLYDKLEIYRDRIRVLEYFLFDPRGEYLDPVLQGYRLPGGQYAPLAMAAEAEAEHLHHELASLRRQLAADGASEVR
jgi:Uma2 family endonuclease